MPSPTTCMKDPANIGFRKDGIHGAEARSSRPVQHLAHLLLVHAALKNHSISRLFPSTTMDPVYLLLLGLVLGQVVLLE